MKCVWFILTSTEPKSKEVVFVNLVVGVERNFKGSIVAKGNKIVHLFCLLFIKTYLYTAFYENIFRWVTIKPIKNTVTMVKINPAALTLSTKLNFKL